jgi:hypothetical protein
MKTTGNRTLKTLSWAIAAASALSAAPSFAQQASINLTGATISYCNTSENTWEVSKTADASEVTSPALINWTVTATKNGSSDPVQNPNAMICAEGTVTISNGGAVPATIGNIVVNLQKNAQVSGKNRWVSAAADVATASGTSPSNTGDAATVANIVATASAENPLWNCVSPNATACNYAVVGAQGTFTETPGISGSIEFTDANNNTIWAISPAQNIPLGSPVTLKYKAMFTNKIFNSSNQVVGGMQIPDGASLRTEVIVTFGNAGGRGGSGASATGIDIDGDGTVNSTFENHVRSVPVRLTSAVPAWVNCNDSAYLSDLITTTGSVVWNNEGGLGDQPISASGSFSYSTFVAAGSGTITNTVDLVGAPNNEDDACCKTAEATSFATVTVLEPDCGPNCSPPPPPCTVTGDCPTTGQFCTYTMGGWGAVPHGGNPASKLAANFAAGFPNGVFVGTSPSFNMTFTTAQAIQDYLPAGGTSGALTTNLVNPTSTSAGNFGGQVTALALAVGLSGTGPFPAGLGSVMLNTSQGPMSIGQILSTANTLLGGGTVDGWSIGDMQALATNINEGFDECKASSWVIQNYLGAGN